MKSNTRFLLLALTMTAMWLSLITSTKSFGGAIQAQDLNGEWLNGDQTVTLHQNGSQVWFDYRGGRGHENLAGRVTGNFDGKTIRGTFTNREGNVAGSGNVYFNLNGNQLVGRWEGNGHSGDWILTRKGNGGGGGATFSAYKLEGFWQFHQQCKGSWELLFGIKPTSDTTFEGGFENGNGLIKDGRISGNQITFTRVIYGDQVQKHWGTLVNEGGHLKIINGGWSGQGQETCTEAKTWRAEKR